MTKIVPPKTKTCAKCGKTKSTNKFLRGDDLCRICRNITKIAMDVSLRGGIPSSSIKKEEIPKKRCEQCGEDKTYHEFSYRLMRGKKQLQPVCRECHSTDVRRNNAHKRRDPLKSRNTNLLHMYGITLVEYNEMLEAQGGVCACCKLPERRKLASGAPRPLSVDHSHIHSGIRGLLCDDCNQAVGLMQENPERVLLLLKYIEERCLW